MFEWFRDIRLSQHSKAHLIKSLSSVPISILNTSVAAVEQRLRKLVGYKWAQLAVYPKYCVDFQS